MPDFESNQLAPETAQPAVAAPTAPAADAAPLSERERIYAQYYAQEPSAAPAPEQVTPAPEPAAAPQAAEQLPAQAPVAAPPAADPTLAALVAEIQALKAQLAPPPAPSVPQNLNPAEQKDWLALMAEGKKAEGEALFARKVEEQISDRIQTQALERMEANRAMYEFTTKLRSENTDLAPMEDYIAHAANFQITQARQASIAAGKGDLSPADYAKVYQTAVTAEIEKARKLVNTFRGVGKNEALTRSREVVSTQTLQPQAINQNREQAPAAAPQETVEDYFKARQQRSLAGKGLGV